MDFLGGLVSQFSQPPKESSMGDRLRCVTCNSVLPPCKRHDDFHKQYMHGMDVYVYNRGQYFREVGDHDAYKCEGCFYKPIREEEEREKEEQRRREEERREEDRRKEEERRREEERKREADQKRWEAELRPADPSLKPTERVLRVRVELINRIGDATLKSLLDGLQKPSSEGPAILNPRERDMVLKTHPLTQDQVTCLVDMLRNKGERPCLAFIMLLQQLEYDLCTELGL
ncbi:uncharacterized protein LOC134466178 [Engraulis encrasicolus]|uniref:uncharacterized protein LOC134466178 n=1 Tax=Engraulis encrasicolus TaxID=184585 RepID=UPI002FD4FA38